MPITWKQRHCSWHIHLFARLSNRNPKAGISRICSQRLEPDMSSPYWWVDQQLLVSAASIQSWSERALVVHVGGWYILEWHMVKKRWRTSTRGSKKIFPRLKGYLLKPLNFGQPSEQALSGPCGRVCPDMQVTKTAEGSRYPLPRNHLSLLILGPEHHPY